MAGYWPSSFLKNAVSVNHFKQLIKKVALADISDSHTAIM